MIYTFLYIKTVHAKGRNETKSQYPLSRPTCNYCKKPGHLVSECLKLKRKLERDEAKPTGLTTLRPRPLSSIKGVHLLLGNDLAGDKVVVNPLVTDTPNIGQTDDPIEQEIPDLYPSRAVTRAMAKKAIMKNSNSDIDLTDTFIGQYFDNEIKKSLDPSLSDTQTDSSMSCHSPPRSIEQKHDTLSKSQLIQEQQTDPEISKLIFRALPEDEISQVPMCYYIKNEILMRKRRPFDVPADDEWTVYHQIVVPKSYRHEILSIAHEFLELDFLLWNIVLEVSGPVYNLITRNYATDFNMNFMEVSLLL